MNYLDVKIDWKARMPESQAQKVEAHDAIDRFSVEWSRERPDLDFTYLATLGRILRLSAHLREAMDEWLEPYGITWEMFDLLASLQRSGYANGMRPTDLYEACMLSSGATTNRIDRAEKLNYAARRPDTEDGRSTRIALTKRGAGLTHRAMTRHSSCAGEIAGRLSGKEQQLLARLLRSSCFRLRAKKAKRRHQSAPRRERQNPQLSRSRDRLCRHRRTGGRLLRALFLCHLRKIDQVHLAGAEHRQLFHKETFCRNHQLRHMPRAREGHEFLPRRFAIVNVEQQALALARIRHRHHCKDRIRPQIASNRLDSGEGDHFAADFGETLGPALKF